MPRNSTQIRQASQTATRTKPTTTPQMFHDKSTRYTSLTNHNIKYNHHAHDPSYRKLINSTQFRHRTNKKTRRHLLQNPKRQIILLPYLHSQTNHFHTNKSTLNSNFIRHTHLSHYTQHSYITNTTRSKPTPPTKNKHLASYLDPDAIQRPIQHQTQQRR